MEISSSVARSDRLPFHLWPPKNALCYWWVCSLCAELRRITLLLSLFGTIIASNTIGRAFFERYIQWKVLSWIFSPCVGFGERRVGERRSTHHGSKSNSQSSPA